MLFFYKQIYNESMANISGKQRKRYEILKKKKLKLKLKMKY